MSDNQDMDNIIELTDEDGNTVQFEHLLTFEYKDRFYVGLLPVEPILDMEEGEVLIMRLDEDGDDDVFSPVETEEELEGAWNAFMENYYEDDEEGCECGCEDCAEEEGGCDCGCTCGCHKEDE